MWFFLLFLIILSFAYTGLSLAPWVPTFSRDLKRVNHLAKLKEGEKFLEIGCGDGKVCHYIAKMNPKAQVIGVELSPIMYGIAQLRNIISPQKNLEIWLNNLYKVDFHPFDVIYVFGLPDKMNQRLRLKFESELQPCSRIISYSFEILGWVGKQSKEKTPGNLAIYVYEK